ncbi:uncharacterized protein NPIL_4831 [Nephila pilipes]|uniref:Peptidase aspartic putative domain-containing protein n=1 Tax=Nephila pilipes TaxID=299642 RepID=A0A8X6P0X9_NEPPI|nr:uncharacterized protein NPIL_4831 [Nephila pilipes]
MNFMPTLEHIALVKVTTLIISNPEVQEHIGVIYTLLNLQEMIAIVKEKVGQCELTMLLQKKVINTAIPLRDELFSWQEIHRDILDCDLVKANDLCWSSVGTIDEPETAKRLIHCDKFTFKQRFTLACCYWFTDDVLKLWQESSVHEKGNLTDRIGSIRVEDKILKKWIQWLQERTESEKQYPFDDELFCCENVPSPTYLFPKLSPQQARDLLIHGGHNFRLRTGRICLSRIDINDKTFFKKMHGYVLFVFLEWPLQTQFKSMVDRLWSYLTEDTFIRLLLVIIVAKIQTDCQDFDYANLLRYLWVQSPKLLKDSAEKSEHFKYITEANLSFLIRCQGQEIIIRAVIDSGSQSSYVSEKIMTQLKAFHLRTETVIHELFRGDETETKSHKVFAIERIYLLEIYSKESVDGELGGEESNSNNMTDNDNNVTYADAVIVRSFTSSGRPVKAPTRLDPLNNVCYTLETLSESQGGGARMLRNTV